MQKALIIKTTGEWEIQEFTVGKSYDLLRAGVGGWIECVHLPQLNADLWVNEEGKLIGLPLNHFGTTLWTSEYGHTDLIMGDIVLTGGPDEEGDTLGLTDEQIQNLLKMTHLV